MIVVALLDVLLGTSDFALLFGAHQAEKVVSATVAKLPLDCVCVMVP